MKKIITIIIAVVSVFVVLLVYQHSENEKNVN